MFEDFFVYFGNSPLSDTLLKIFFTQSVARLDSVFHRTEVSNFNEVQLINYYFHGSCLSCYIQKDITIPYVIF